MFQEIGTVQHRSSEALTSSQVIGFCANECRYASESAIRRWGQRDRGVVLCRGRSTSGEAEPSQLSFVSLNVTINSALLSLCPTEEETRVE